jgi:hypothetical protein
MGSKIVTAKIHPSIGIARVGNSPSEFFLGPEVPGVPPKPFGGFKDADGLIKRQAPRFRIFGYDAGGNVVSELTAKEANIEWTVHLANLKASWKQFQSHFVSGEAHLRNAHVNGDDRKRLEIDPGSRTISGVNTKNTPGSNRYSFDSGQFFETNVYLGELQTDDAGRLLVLGGRGTSESTSSDFDYIRQYANNNNWHDDVSDGPVNAVVTIDGIKIQAVPSWVIVAPPDFSPYTFNLVTAYDVMYQVAVNEGWLSRPTRVSFTRDIFPILQRSAGYTWVSANSLRGHGIGEPGDLLAPDMFAKLCDNSKTAKAVRQKLFQRIRRPDINYTGDASYYYMPQLSGDGGNAATLDKTLWLTVTQLQYEMLAEWNKGSFDADWPPTADPRIDDPAVSPGLKPAALDRASLTACVGGAFFPGIEITYIASNPKNYREAFRLSDTTLNAGDITKWMAVPWQADFFECYDVWWPAQRPDDVVTNEAYQDAIGIWQAGVSGTSPTPSFLTLIEGREKWVRGLTDEIVLALGPDGNPILDPVDPGTVKEPKFLKYHLGDRAMVTAWKDMGFVYPAPTPDGSLVLIEHERAPFAGLQDLRAFFYLLLNIDGYPEFLSKAREIADYYLDSAWRRMHEPNFQTPQYRFFPYSPGAFHNRLMDIYVSLQEQGDAKIDPTTREAEIFGLLQRAPFNQLDGAWLRNATQAGPIEEINALLFSIWADEIGNGTTSLNHCNLYTELLASVGVVLPDIRSRAYADDERFFRSAFAIPVFELAISQFSIDYFPEILGMTLNLEWEVLSLRPRVKALESVGIDTQFYVMHIGIDNASEGHGAKAKRAVELYLDHMFRQGGEELRQAMWKRIWTGYVAFATTGDVGDDIARAVYDRKHTTAPNYLANKVSDLITAKKEYAQFNHLNVRLEGDFLNDLFKDPQRLMQALQYGGFISPGDPEHSLFFTHTTTFDGPMYKVFTEDELDLLKDWTRSLQSLSRPLIATIPTNAELMVDAINLLREDGSQEPAHQGYKLTGVFQGAQRNEPVAWWLQNADSPATLQALAQSPHVVAGDPDASDFYSKYLGANTGMGQRWSVKTKRDPSRSYRDIANDWIKEGCPLPSTAAVSPVMTRHEALNMEGLLRLQAIQAAPEEPQRRRPFNPYGMQAVH